MKQKKMCFQTGCKTKTKTEKLKDVTQETLSHQTTIRLVHFHHTDTSYIQFILTSSDSIHQYIPVSHTLLYTNYLFLQFDMFIGCGYFSSFRYPFCFFSYTNTFHFNFPTVQLFLSHRSLCTSPLHRFRLPSADLRSSPHTLHSCL
jgi:hypothetical protein